VDVIIPVVIPDTSAADAYRVNGDVLIAALDDTQTNFMHVSIGTQTQAGIRDLDAKQHLLAQNPDPTV